MASTARILNRSWDGKCGKVDSTTQGGDNVDRDAVQMLSQSHHASATGLSPLFTSQTAIIHGPHAATEAHATRRLSVDADSRA